MQDGAGHETGGRGNVAIDLLKGALAGAVGVWALDRVTWFLWDRENPAALARERRARPGGLDPAHAMANAVASAAGHPLTPRQPHPAGITVHYGLRVGPGALYGALRHRAGWVTSGGLLLGLGLFVLQDEIGNTVLGTAGRPTQYPWQAHARGLLGHLVFGATAERVLALELPRWNGRLD